MSLQYCVEKYTPPCLGEFEGVHSEGLFVMKVITTDQSTVWLLKDEVLTSVQYRSCFKMAISMSLLCLFQCPCHVESHMLRCELQQHQSHEEVCFYISQIGWPNNKVVLALLMPLTHLKAKWICIKLLVDSLTYIIMHLHIIMIGFILAWFCPSGDWKVNIF